MRHASNKPCLLCLLLSAAFGISLVWKLLRTEFVPATDDTQQSLQRSLTASIPVPAPEASVPSASLASQSMTGRRPSLFRMLRGTSATTSHMRLQRLQHDNDLLRVSSVHELPRHSKRNLLEVLGRGTSQSEAQPISRDTCMQSRASATDKSTVSDLGKGSSAHAEAGIACTAASQLHASLPGQTTFSGSSDGHRYVAGGQVTGAQHLYSASHTTAPAQQVKPKHIPSRLGVPASVRSSSRLHPQTGDLLKYMPHTPYKHSGLSTAAAVNGRDIQGVCMYLQ